VDPDFYLRRRAHLQLLCNLGVSDTPLRLKPWGSVTFFLDITLQQASLALDLFSDENIEQLLSPRQVDVWRYMQTAKEVTPKELSDALEIPRPTINQVLNRLIDLNKIERIGLGRGTRYRVSKK
jgi:predicted HTH transcriptional regulator